MKLCELVDTYREVVGWQNPIRIWDIDRVSSPGQP